VNLSGRGDKDLDTVLGNSDLQNVDRYIESITGVHQSMPVL